MPGKIGILDTRPKNNRSFSPGWQSFRTKRFSTESPRLRRRASASKLISPPFGVSISVNKCKPRSHDLSLAREGNLPDADRATMLSAASDALIQKAFQLAANPKANGFALAALTQSLVSLQRQKLREKQLDLAERRLELERKKLEAALALKEAQSPTEYQEQKIRAARETLFKCLKGKAYYDF